MFFSSYFGSLLLFLVFLLSKYFNLYKYNRIKREMTEKSSRLVVRVSKIEMTKRTFFSGRKKAFDFYISFEFEFSSFFFSFLLLYVKTLLYDIYTFSSKGRKRKVKEISKCRKKDIASCHICECERESICLGVLKMREKQFFVSFYLIFLNLFWFLCFIFFLYQMFRWFSRKINIHSKQESLVYNVKIEWRFILQKCLWTNSDTYIWIYSRISKAR